MTTTHHGNPYTHEEHKRESKVNYNRDECPWCGQKPKYLYQYDNSRGWFCNKGCWIEYHS